MSILSTIRKLEALTEESITREPGERAEVRMAAAFSRGGWNGLVTATETRIKAMKDADKIDGLLAILDEMADDIETLIRQAKHKKSQAN